MSNDSSTTNDNNNQVIKTSNPYIRNSVRLFACGAVIFFPGIAIFNHIVISIGAGLIGVAFALIIIAIVQVLPDEY